MEVRHSRRLPVGCAYAPESTDPNGALVAERVSTRQLGQFTDEHAEQIAAGLEAAGIVWWHKTHGRLMRTLSFQDWGTRLYVDESRFDEARAIAEEIAGPLP